MYSLYFHEKRVEIYISSQSSMHQPYVECATALFDTYISSEEVCGIQRSNARVAPQTEESMSNKQNKTKTISIIYSNPCNMTPDSDQSAIKIDLCTKSIFYQDQYIPPR